jgi:hypothetical protein
MSKIFILPCPANYVGVSSLAPYTTAPFCVAKYEIKIQGQADGAQTYSSAFVDESRPDGTPWTKISATQATTECQALGSGYDLISNAQWQTLAQTIEDVAWNWNTATVGNIGGLSRGNTQLSPNIALAADADDNNACFGIPSQTCSSTVWNYKR